MGTEGADLRVIAGRYRLEARIGRGGMGIVWRATDQLLGRRVAVKELPFDETLSAEEARQQRDRTLREARAVAQLRHPHVIVVHDIAEQDERPFIVMELIEGGSLADRIAERGPVDAAEAARIGIALLSALRTAHAAGVLHRDIKPANVLVESGTDRVVLTDFGIAQVAGATTLTETGSFVGSPEYTAPERMSGGGTGPQSDLWSLGALLCTVLSGESPFRRDSLGGILHAVVMDEIRPPAQAGPILPVVRGLLERDPDRRLEAAEAERMLRAFLETGHTPQPSRPSSSPSRYTPTQRNLPQAPPSTEPTRATRSNRSSRSGSVTSASADSSGGADGSGAQAASGGPSSSQGPGVPGGAGGAQEAPGPRSTRGVLAVALLVAALAGAGVSAAALLMNGGGSGGHPSVSSAPGTAVGVPGRDPAGTATGSSPTPSVSVSPSSTVPSGPAATVTETRSAPAAAGGPTAPSGYHLVHDRAGFSVAVPDGFTRSPQGVRIFYMSPGETFRLGIKSAEPEAGGPLAVMRRADAAGPDTNPGYHDGRVTGTSHLGHPAALWEFTWNGFSAAEGPRHTYDLCWEQNGRMYDVWVSAPVGKVREAKEYFDVAVDTFNPA
ncbi:serine/threonine-protein kinase [Streptomyces sp. NRRL S-813]|uniref:serine/threonine-protein kinase n=1 Tax=Streptomyces sp. NRRL S-813 TaxID=1463919 RepID=UPI0004C1F678|nr:serine/threonine-protein kinase [Streptomyces sp. NRRL S-813]